MTSFKSGILTFIIATVTILTVFPDHLQAVSVFSRTDTSANDTVKESQILFNGKMWRNLYYRVKGDQYLFSSGLLPGDLTISGKKFQNLQLRYDIYNDEIMTSANNGIIIQLNKEMVDSFSFTFLMRKYSFIKVSVDTVKGFTGYINLIYKGKSDLCVKYTKEISLLAVEKKYDLFNQSHRIFLVTDKGIHSVMRAGDIYKAVPEYKEQIKNYIKKNKITLSKDDPDSFIPVIRFYDTLHN
jgi:hypothetical protein